MSRFAKAITALVTALGTWGVTAYSDEAVSSVELFGLCGVLVAALTVYAVPNEPPAGEPRDPDMSERVPEAGMTSAEVCALTFVICLALLVVIL